MYCQPRQITLNINDDGHGFDSAKIRPGSLGMNIMRERAESIGASLDINSVTDHGTEVIVTWQDFTKED